MRYTSIDISPTSGRIRRGFLSSGRMVFDSEYTFKNNLKTVEGQKVWDLDEVVLHIVKGLETVGESDYISISSWSYDFVLLDWNGDVVGQCVSFQDGRLDSVRDVFEPEEFFNKTGQHPIKYSTFNQLLSIKEESPELFDASDRLLFISDYLVYRLTGQIANEFTIASTSSLLDLETGDWNYSLIKSVGIPERLFQSLSKPGLSFDLKDDVVKEIGYEAKLMLVPSDRIPLSLFASHLDRDTFLIYAGGLSTIGVASEKPIVDERTFNSGLNNVLLPDGNVFLTKRIAAGRILRSFKSEFENGMTFNEIETRARKIKNPDVFKIDERFYIERPVSSEIKEILGKDMDSDEIAASIYASIVNSYIDSIKDVETLLDRECDEISISGGIVRDRYLNMLLAVKSGKIVLSGDDSPASLSSLLYMAMNTGEISDENVEKVLRKSLFLTTYRRSY